MPKSRCADVVLVLLPLMASCSTQADGEQVPPAAATSVASGSSAAATSASPPPAPPPPPPPEAVTLVATGDVLIHQDGALTAGAAVEGGGYDFENVFAPVAPMIRAADLAICHLETPVAAPGGPFRGYPRFVAQPQIVAALAGAGYDLCSTASNHSLDDGFDGLTRTLDVLEAAGVAHTGTHRSEQESLEPTIVDAGGVRVGHVAGTFSLNGIPLPDGQPWAVDVVEVPDVEPMRAAAARARAAGAEIVVASLHCCAEYDHDPTRAQEQAARTLLASPDVDLVLGHHAHVVQPFEEIDGEWIAYGLGNHLAEQATLGYATEESVMARFTFTRDSDGRFTVSEVEAVPLLIDRRADGLRIVPADPVTFDLVAGVLDRRGASTDGLAVVPD
ncbi:CapA family protein [Blastococcus capsensis]|uniref:CapA family protein n=1 Tax=Blastococcus capsensis TaxID=1564163 RepID=UPI002541FDFF|nr:CapA family protein [Blastococcus capsensis]MDK3258421.1 CapA family protein [Blastococcus capsensis]